jgi:hypothetical protein
MLILSSAARPLASAIGSDMKGNVWPLPQAAAILIALAAPLVSYALFVLVPAIWSCPTLPIERAVSH